MSTVGKSLRLCAQCHRNTVTPPIRVCNKCKKNTRNAAARARNSHSFGWGVARVLSSDAAQASSSGISANGDCLHELAEARRRAGECPHCGFANCLCATTTEIQHARIWLHSEDDRCASCGLLFEHCRCGYPAPEVMV